MTRAHTGTIYKPGKPPTQLQLADPRPRENPVNQWIPGWLNQHTQELIERHYCTADGPKPKETVKPRNGYAYLGWTLGPTYAGLEIQISSNEGHFHEFNQETGRTYNQPFDMSLPWSWSNLAHKLNRHREKLATQTTRDETAPVGAAR